MSQSNISSIKKGVLRKPFTEAFTLPGEMYFDEKIFREERQRIFSSMWINVGRDEDLAEPGSYFTWSMDKERLLIVRGKDNKVRAFFNVCRHRGSRLVDDDSGCGLHRITCPYHAWTYGSDGRLLSAPTMGEDFNRDDFPLVEAPCDTFAGFIFINLDENAAPLTEYLRDLPDLTRYRLDQLRRGATVEYEIDANWKLICENYNECYHCAMVHPQLHRISDANSGGKLERGACFSGGSMYLNEGFSTMTLSGHSNHPVIPGLSKEDHRTVHYYTVYPNFLISPHPDYLLTHTIWPLAPDRSRITCEWFFTREAINKPGFDPSDAVEFWDVTNKQDWGLCVRAQQGAESKGYRPGKYHSHESAVWAFDDWYLKHMGY
jgi:Rieske 2Fe-2S family protein